jgi:hypothetical protein
MTTPEDVLIRLLAEGDVRLGENLLHINVDLEISDDESELILEMLNEQEDATKGERT